MKELSLEQMEKIEGGLLWQLAFLSISFLALQFGCEGWFNKNECKFD